MSSWLSRNSRTKKAHPLPISAGKSDDAHEPPSRGQLPAHAAHGRTPERVASQSLHLGLHLGQLFRVRVARFELATRRIRDSSRAVAIVDPLLQFGEVIRHDGAYQREDPPSALEVEYSRFGATRRVTHGTTDSGPPCTGSVITLDSATAKGFKVARPHATSIGKREKSTMQPSRL